MKISRRSATTTASPLRSLVERNDESIHVHRLNIGQPDIKPPKEFFDGLKKHTKTNGSVPYEAAAGNKQLIHQWTKLLNSQYKTNITPDEMIITAGSSEALTFVFSVCCDVNDEILVFSPSYANYAGFAAISGVTLVPIEMDESESFRAGTDTYRIIKHITDRTRAMLICSPNNPTGTVFTQAEIRHLLDIAETHDLYLIVDEVYREFVYDNIQPRCIFQDSRKNGRVIVVDSVSKRYSLCGARVGCIISPNKDIITSVLNCASTRVSTATLEQKAVAHMLEHMTASYLKNAVEEYRGRRDVLIQELAKIEGVEYTVPDGGFYVLVKLPIDDARLFAQFMLRDFSVNGVTVSIAPASAFFINSTISTSYVRIAFVAPKPALMMAVNILAKALDAYRLSIQPMI